jgi:hypothetical protein
MKFTYTCSLGPFCHSTNILKQNNLKMCSYPFDWIFSNYNNILHCIKNDFNIFLDKSYYQTISQTRCSHSYYGKDMFRHHNPLIHVSDYNYYIRCIDRFKVLLKKKRRKLFINIIVNNETIDELMIHSIIDFNNKLALYTNNYILLIILHLKNKQKNHHKFTIKGNIHFLELHTLSISDGLKFMNESDNMYLNNIMRTIYL